MASVPTLEEHTYRLGTKIVVWPREILRNAGEALSKPYIVDTGRRVKSGSDRYHTTLATLTLLIDTDVRLVSLYLLLHGHLFHVCILFPVYGRQWRAGVPVDGLWA